MSDTRSLTAWFTSRFTNLTIGASSRTSERLDRSGSSSASAGEGLGYQRRDGAVDGPVAEVDELEPNLARQGPDELGFRDRALFDQQAAERLTALRLLGQGCIELRLGQQAFVDQQRTERRPVRHTPLLGTGKVSATRALRCISPHGEREIGPLGP